MTSASRSSWPIGAATTTAGHPRSPYVQGQNAMHECASTIRAAKASRFGQEVAVARVSHGGVYGRLLITPLAPPLYL
jgi:hypothetical protein